MTKDIQKEGWALDTTSHNKTHYYKAGISLCGKNKSRNNMTYDKNRSASIYFKDCAICIKKLKTINNG